MADEKKNTCVSDAFAELLKKYAERSETNVQAALQTSQGRSLLASSLVAPLRTTRDYQSAGRRVFLVDAIGFQCAECGFYHPDEKYEHSDEECITHKVMET